MKYFTILFVLTTALLFSCNTQQDSNTVTDTNKTAFNKPLRIQQPELNKVNLREHLSIG